ncbi:DEAD/DEAH box helicase family protein [Ruminococcaceae bacterium OttesenSCG-928-I18]|nr:DEAD/DEAH box helicase family protein [Ruminococcaceae bacterium OttesenSCG-928-I18]
MNKQNISDIISNEDIDGWKTGDIVAIDAGTGSGKTYFVMNKLYEKAKCEGSKIVVFFHRNNTKNQFQQQVDEEGKGDVIELQTYQYLEHKIKDRKQRQQIGRFTYSKYRYIVCDESHYFIDDASFNHDTDLSFSEIMQMDMGIRIFMSATNRFIKAYINNTLEIKTIDYILKPDFSHIKKLVFYTNEDALEVLMEEWKASNEKAMLFIQSAEKGIKFHNRYFEQSMFVCSSSNPKSKKFYNEYVNTELVESTLKNERFESQFFITTSCFDAGINIKDANLHNIVVDMQDIDVLAQCIGRKRILNESDHVNLYVRLRTNKQLNGDITHNKKVIKAVDVLRNEGQKAYVNKYFKTVPTSSIIYDDVENGEIIKRINELMYHKLQTTVKEYQYIIKWCSKFGRLPADSYGYCKYIAGLLDRYDPDIDVYSYSIEDGLITLEHYLEQNLGCIYLTEKDRKPLIEKIAYPLKTKSGKSNGKYAKTINVLNGYLKDIYEATLEGDDGLINYLSKPYQIEKFSTSRMENGKKANYKAAWRIILAGEGLNT